MPRVVGCCEDDGWEGLHRALTQAGPGDEVQAGPGIYRGRVALAVPAGVRMSAAAGATLVNEGEGPILRLAAPSAQVSGLHFVAAVVGQVMLQVEDTEDITIDHCSFDGADLADVAIFAVRSRAVRVHDCSVNACNADEGPGRAGIRFLSTQGEVLHSGIQGGLRGITLARDPASAQTPSQALVMGNRCSGSRLDGIAFFSSTGRAEGNECSGSQSGCGIVIGRDSSSPTEGSQVDVVGNRCHDNEFAGIAFGSSTGRAEGNECRGSKTGHGIAIQRDSISATEASQVDVVGNRCHDNEFTGIVYFSSTGRAEGNECSASKKYAGIAILRDLASPTEGSQVDVVGNRCHGNESAGIVFASSTGRADGNECWGSKKSAGIAVERDQNSPTEGSQVDAVGNRCHDNESAGIMFLSSTGRAEGNECWGSKTGQGIAIGRNAASLAEGSQVDVVGNRCHDNESAGIAFFSSTGRAEGNECWGSKKYAGIAIKRDPNSPTEASQVDVVGNRCHDNESTGIMFESSTGRAEGNECWGSKTGQGIAIGRDPASPAEASQVNVVGNRCHDNESAGILFLSSTGRAEGNECWGSKTRQGIMIQRDSRSPAEASQVDVVGNRCHGNENAGIVFASSTGRAEGNECWGTKTGSGIAIGCDPASPAEGSQVDVVGNRCYDNESAGIAFLSSTGRAEGNECWASKKHAGIAILRDLASPTEGSQVDVVGNRCHDNESAGIVFISSTGRAEGNECWGSKKSAGIAIQRDQKSPTEGSQVDVVGNRCHDNESAGIVFISSTGRAEGNECWGSKKSAGIAIQRDQKSPTEGSQVDVVGNRCHDNESAGIVFISSTGRAEGNECWGSKTGQGIAIGRDPASPAEASQVDVVSNRCHDNESVGIAFFSSTGRAEGNECGGNKLGDSVHIEAAPGGDVPPPRVSGHRITESDGKEARHHRLLDAHPLAGWLKRSSEPDGGETELADFLTSGGCPAAWGRFWLAAAEPWRLDLQEPPSPPVPQAAGASVWRISSMDAKPGSAVELTPPGELSPAAAGRTDSPPGLDALKARFLKLAARAAARQRGRDGVRAKPPRWCVALLSADAPAFQDWLATVQGSGAAGGAGARVEVIDIAQLQAADGNDATGGLYQRAIAQRPFGERFVLGAKAVVLAPAHQGLVSAGLLALGVGLSLALLAWAWKLTWWPLWPGPGVPPAGLPALWQALDEKWASEWKWLLGALLVTAVFALLSLNRLLPGTMGIPPERLADGFESVEVPLVGKALKWLVRAGRTDSPFGRALRWLGRPRSIQRAWVRRQLYGGRWWAAWRLAAPPPAVIVLRGVDVPTAAECEHWREWLALCPRRQAVLLVTQMNGLSSFVSGFLDVWAPLFRARAAGPSPRAPEAFVIHDPASGRLPVPGAEAGAAVLEGDVERLGVVWKMAGTLGWPRPDRDAAADPGQMSPAVRRANSLLSPKVGAEALLPMLLIGSTPYADMAIRRANDNSAQPMNEAAAAYLEMLLPTLAAKPGEFSTPELAELDADVKRADGLLLVESDRQRQLLWIGRAGHRVHLAHALRSYAAAARQEGDRDVDDLLACSLACGEHFHLGEALTAWDLGSASSEQPEAQRRAQLAVPRLQAALYLRQEQQAFAAPPQARQRAVELWGQVAERLSSPGAQGYPVMADAVRAWAAVLSAAHSLGTAAAGTTLERLSKEIEDRLRRVLDDPWAAPAVDEGSAASAAIADVHALLLTLAARPRDTALALMQAKLAQEWFGLPAGWKQALSEAVENLTEAGRRWLHASDSVTELLERAMRLREQPALVLSTLAGLAAGDLRWRFRAWGAVPGAEERPTLTALADGFKAMRDALVLAQKEPATLVWPAESVADMPWTEAEPHCPAAAAATALLMDEALRLRLCEAFVQGLDTARQLAPLAAAPGSTIEGLSFGVHGKLHGVLQLARDADERALQRAPSAARRTATATDQAGDGVQRRGS